MSNCLHKEPSVATCHKTKTNSVYKNVITGHFRDSSSLQETHSFLWWPLKKLAHSKQVFLLPTQKTEGIPTTSIIKYLMRKRATFGLLVCSTCTHDSPTARYQTILYKLLMTASDTQTPFLNSFHLLGITINENFFKIKIYTLIFLKTLGLNHVIVYITVFSDDFGMENLINCCKKLLCPSIYIFSWGHTGPLQKYWQLCVKVFMGWASSHTEYITLYLKKE